MKYEALCLSTLNGYLYLLYSLRTNSRIVFLEKKKWKGYFICVFAMDPKHNNDRENNGIILHKKIVNRSNASLRIPFFMSSINNFPIRLCFFSLDIFYAIFISLFLDKMKIIKIFKQYWSKQNKDGDLLQNFTVDSY